MKRTYRRKNLFSYPTVQLRIILLLAGMMVVFSLANYYMGRSAFERMRDGMRQLPVNPETYQADLAVVCERESTTLNLQLLLFGVLSTGVVVVSGVYLSHKIAGPIYRLRKYLKDTGAGGMKPVVLRFRKLDFFQELAVDFNAFQRARGLLPPDEPPKPGTSA